MRADRSIPRPRGAALASVLAAALATAGCAPEGFPEDPLFSDLGDLEVQSLDPIDPILDNPIGTERTEGARDELLERGETLRGRADDLRARDG